MPRIAKPSKQTKGALEVRAIRRTRRGFNDSFIEEGSIGYVLGQRPGHDKYLIEWHIVRQYSGDNRCSVHPIADVEPTGNRGK